MLLNYFKYDKNKLKKYKLISKNLNVYKICVQTYMSLIYLLIIRITKYTLQQLLCRKRDNMAQLAVISLKHVQSWNPDNHTSASAIFKFSHFTQLHPLYQPSSVIFCQLMMRSILSLVLL